MVSASDQLLPVGRATRLPLQCGWRLLTALGPLLTPASDQLLDPWSLRRDSAAAS